MSQAHTEQDSRMNAFGRDIPSEAIRIFSGAISKFQALEAMIDAVHTLGAVTDREALKKALFEREAIRSTGFRGVAIPHVRIDEILAPTVCVGVSVQGIDFEALDSDPVNIIVMFAMPSGSDKEYLGLLAQVMMALRSDDFCDKLVACATPEEVLDVLESKDD